MKKKIIKNMIYLFFRLIYRLLFKKPTIRYSPYFAMAVDNIFQYTWKEKIFRTVMELAKIYKTDGDYLEFGVGGGESFTMAFHFAEINDLKSMNFYAFDSFQGLPKPKGIDAEIETYQKSQFICSLNNFKKNLLKNKVDLDRVKIIPGWFNETLTKETKRGLGIKKAAVVFIDCNLYESTVPVLDFITDYLVDGTILIFDDWFVFRGNPNYGERKAFNQWLKKNPEIKITEFQKYSTVGNSFIVHK